MAKSRRAKRNARRSLRAITIENVIEGCVRETYSALIAFWQAQTAADVRVRQATQRIGADEAGHAQFAWNIKRWATSKLSPAARRAVERARCDALRSLHAELDEQPREALAARAWFAVQVSGDGAASMG